MKFEFDDVARVLQNIDADCGISECHGMLCGLLCTEGQNGFDIWLNQIAPQRDNNNLLVQEAEELLSSVNAEVLREFNDPECDFQPLLPSDGTAIEDRISAICQWCQGFLVGMSYGGIKDFSRLPGDSVEIVKDFSKITKASQYKLQGTEQDEVAYSDIVEYVRVGVLLIYEELNPVAPTKGDGSNIH